MTTIYFHFPFFLHFTTFSIRLRAGVCDVVLRGSVKYTSLSLLFLSFLLLLPHFSPSLSSSTHFSLLPTVSLFPSPTSVS